MMGGMIGGWTAGARNRKVPRAAPERAWPPGEGIVNALFHRVSYYLAQRARGEDVAGVLRELEASQRWSAERLDALQWERQQALARHAWETAPWWRERWTALGLQPGDLRTRADWARLPALDKREVQEHGHDMTSSRAPRGLKAATSGSSGTPVAVVRSHHSWAHAHANVIRGWHWHGIEVGERYGYFWGVPLAEADRRVAERKDRFFNRERVSAFTLDPERARAAHARLLARGTRWAFGYPSALTLFAEEVLAQRLDGRALRWKAVVTTAEVLHPHQRERIHDVFGCAVVDSYGCAEAGVAGFECERGGMHVPVESVVVDIVATSDGLEEVLLTDLHNLSQPLIRYRVGDLVERAPAGERCECGRGLPLLGRVGGRAGDTLELPDGRRVNANLPSYIFKQHGKAGTVREYQFVQFPAGRVELRVTAGPAWREATRDELRAQVREVLGIEASVVLVERFERRGRGKHRDYVRAEDLGEA